MTKIHSEIIGNGPVLVMIHGWSMHSGVWRPLAERLARHFQVVCLDLPGHGRSESCQPYQLQAVTDVLADAVASEHFTLMGWSLGATVAIDMARRYPHRVEKLVLMAGNPCFVERSDWPGVSGDVLTMFSALLLNNWRQTLTRFMALQVNGLSEGKNRLKELKAVMEQAPLPDQTALKAGLEILAGTDLREAFKDLPQPVMALFAEKDNLIPVECRTAMARLKPALKSHMLDGAGHAPFFTHAGEIESRLRQFIDERTA